MAEHGLGERNELSGWLQGLDHRPNITFDLVARDGFAVAGTGFGLAEIVGVGLAAASAVRRTQRRTAIGTADKATQSELVSDVLAHRGLSDAAQALLHFLECLNRDQRIVMSFEPIDAVVF
nr:hypothetical protein [Falsiruegeria litorea]